MLHVISPDRVLEVIQGAFQPLDRPCQSIDLPAALGRVLGEDITAAEWVPDFDRATVDGYALRAADTFGCSDALPALLTCTGKIEMGRSPADPVAPGCCMAIPTGGMLPQGADAVQMVEYTEDYGDGTVGILKGIAPGGNLIFRGDDVRPGQLLFHRGRRLSPRDIGALAALGHTPVSVRSPLQVGVISTGDELLPPQRVPGPGQVRDVNGALLGAVAAQAGGTVLHYGIVPDREEELAAVLETAAAACDLVLLSGGTSVGERDAAVQVIARLGEILFHGVAMKPGKPTLLGRVADKPVFGLPGHPAAALITADLFVRPMMARLEGRRLVRYPVSARLAQGVEANHGRAQYTAVSLRQEDGVLLANPLWSKSGLIAALAGADGYFCVPQNCEGMHEGQEVLVTLLSGEA
ncbi:MAG: molybdopterin molybdotransferase MoeA [Oscillospiraceae bacterium]|nr:molybdopterin molybdotransferase MoeA [Oscillospiraceae bacterium]